MLNLIHWNPKWPSLNRILAVYYNSVPKVRVLLGKGTISVICHLWNEKVLRGDICKIKAILSTASGWLGKLHFTRQSSLRHWTSKHSLICCTFGFASGGLFLMVTIPEGRWEYCILFAALHHAIRAICSLLSWCHIAAIVPACSGYYSQPLAALFPNREGKKMQQKQNRWEKSSRFLL